MGWSWAVAWPMFVILVGVAGAISALLAGLNGCAGLWALTWPVAWIVVGDSCSQARPGHWPLDRVS